MIRSLAALCVAVSLVFGVQAAVPAEASVQANGCAGGPVYPQGGCMHLVGDGLYVDSVRPGVDSFSDCNTYRGPYKVVQINPNGNSFVIHTSSARTFIPCGGAWGPTYYQLRNYADGTKFCGFNASWKPTTWGCVEVRA